MLGGSHLPCVMHHCGSSWLPACQAARTVGCAQLACPAGWLIASAAGALVQTAGCLSGAAADQPPLHPPPPSLSLFLYSRTVESFWGTDVGNCIQIDAAGLVLSTQQLIDSVGGYRLPTATTPKPRPPVPPTTPLMLQPPPPAPPAAPPAGTWARPVSWQREFVDCRADGESSNACTGLLGEVQPPQNGVGCRGRGTTIACHGWHDELRTPATPLPSPTCSLLQITISGLPFLSPERNVSAAQPSKSACTVAHDPVMSHRQGVRGQLKHTPCGGRGAAARQGDVAPMREHKGTRGPFRPD